MPRRKIGSRRILFGRESISFRELADKSNTHTFNKWRRFANLTSNQPCPCSSLFTCFVRVTNSGVAVEWSLLRPFGQCSASDRKLTELLLNTSTISVPLRKYDEK